MRFPAAALVALLLAAVPSRAGAADLAADTWVATDGLGRAVPVFPEVPAPRPGRTVAMFYFLWHGAHIQGGPYDVSRILAADPGAMQRPGDPAWGPLHAPHHWGESLFGYYRTSDDAVLRKHAQMLSDAGVDAVVFDVTNQVTYRDDYRALMRAWSGMRRLGNHTPRVAFLAPFGDPARVVRELWRDLYSTGGYDDLWFRWEGKPLILADPALLPKDGEMDAVRRFFAFRKPQPDYFRGPTAPGMWGWLEVFPQHAFTNAAGRAEQMAVGVAQNAVGGRLGSMSEPGARGRSFHGGTNDARPGAVRLGLNFAEQWDRAHAIDPDVVFVTGWNEWIAGRFDEFNGVRLPVMFVDQFDQEHSRDIEPMRGGHGDDYLWQFVAAVRRYKGARPVPPLVSRPIRIDGRFDDWDGVGPEFRDTVGDPVRRDYPGWGAGVRYRNDTGRNDLVSAKASWGTTEAFFLARTRDALTPPGGTNWMVLFLDVDADARTGWLGYDFAVGITGPGELARWDAGAAGWRRVGAVTWRHAGDALELSVPWKALGLGGPPAALDFKWADNCLHAGDWTDFTLNGDAAPNDRFNYRARQGRGRGGI